jgi:DMSO/TMAO reductase YedYZ molybdopterin-dependent catalytic subunit
MRRILLAMAALALLGIPALAQDSTAGKASTGPSEVKIGGAVTTPFVVTAADLKSMPRKTLRVENEHSKKTQVYEGVLVEDLLRKAGAPLGEKLRGPLMATYVMVEAADDYHVVFSLAELDSGFQDSEILLADTMDGAPLTPDQGPFKLVAPHEKRPARWVKMVKSLTVVRAPVQ